MRVWSFLFHMIPNATFVRSAAGVYKTSLGSQFYKWKPSSSRTLDTPGPVSAFATPLTRMGRVRTIPVPTWVKVAIDAWTSAAGVAEGYIFRPVNRAGQAQGVSLSEKVVWQLLQPYAAAAGVPGIAPHDCRRSCAKKCRAAGGDFGADSVASVRTLWLPERSGNACPGGAREITLADALWRARIPTGVASPAHKSGAPGVQGQGRSHARPMCEVPAHVRSDHI